MSPLNDLWSAARPSAPGKFLYAGDQKLWVRGVTYGTFRPSADGALFPSPATVRQDFAQIAAAGFNAVRTYTAPPPWLLDLAADHGLRVMVGTVVAAARRPSSTSAAAPAPSSARCAGPRVSTPAHPALLGCRHRQRDPGRRSCAGTAPRAVERHLRAPVRSRQGSRPGRARHLRRTIRRPSTSSCRSSTSPASTSTWNRASRLAAYLARLQNIAGDRPLLLAEVGLDSRRHGEAGQAARPRLAARRRVRRRRAPAPSSSRGPTSGTAAACDIEDWDFGLTRRDRCAQARARRGPGRGGRAAVPPEPRSGRMISVVVCSYNGSRTIRDALTWLDAARVPVRTRSSWWTTARPTPPPTSPRGFGVRVISTAQPRPQPRAQRRAGGRQRARSSPTSTTTRSPIRTGSPTWPTPS